MGSVSALAGCSCVPEARKTVPPGTAARSLTAPLTRVPLLPTHLVALADAEALGVRRGELDHLTRAKEAQRRRDVDLLGAPQRAEGPEPDRALAGRRHGRRDLERDGLPGAGVESGGRLRGGPADAAPSEGVEREARVERDRLEELL